MFLFAPEMIMCYILLEQKRKDTIMTRSRELHELMLQYANLDAQIAREHSSLCLVGFDHSELNCIQCIGALEAPNVTSIAGEMGMTRGAVSKIV